MTDEDEMLLRLELKIVDSKLAEEKRRKEVLEKKEWTKWEVNLIIQ